MLTAPFLRLVLAAVVPLSSGCAVTGFFTYGIPNTRANYISEGDPAPDANLMTLSGEPVQLHDYIGKLPLILVFGSFT